MLLLAVAGAARAADEGPGIWLIGSGAGAYPGAVRESRWRWWFDGQVRYFDRDNAVDQYVMRPGVSFSLTDHSSAWLGIALIVTTDDIGNRREERRLWQQYSWSRKLANGKTLALRTRVAQRRRDTGDGTAIWLRQRIALTVPVPHRNDVGIVMAVEPFVDFRDTDWGADPGLAQFRASVGARFRIRHQLSVEAGYMNQYFPRDDQRDILNHLVYFNFRARF